mmetsp:Transcript_24534/g.51189  ORF Transcript_24534/g.51189 Transcript_24534/m.51189 type:complete len:102 (-) Transcript_24534:649-954(-)
MTVLIEHLAQLLVEIIANQPLIPFFFPLMSLLCSECGVSLASGSKFCDKCGTKVINNIEAPEGGFKEVLSTPPSLSPLDTATTIQAKNASLPQEHFSRHHA